MICPICIKILLLEYFGGATGLNWPIQPSLIDAVFSLAVFSEEQQLLVSFGDDIRKAGSAGATTTADAWRSTTR